MSGKANENGTAYHDLRTPPSILIAVGVFIMLFSALHFGVGSYGGLLTSVIISLTVGLPAIVIGVYWLGRFGKQPDTNVR